MSGEHPTPETKQFMTTPLAPCQHYLSVYVMIVTYFLQVPRGRIFGKLSMLARSVMGNGSWQATLRSGMWGAGMSVF